MTETEKNIIEISEKYLMDIPSDRSCTDLIKEGYYAMPTYGSYNDNYYNYGFDYKIVPLNSNLSQRGNDIKMQNKWDKSWRNRIYVGTPIYGDSAIDNKEYAGHVVNFSYKADDKESVEYIWIFDEETMKAIPLKPETVYLDNQVYFSAAQRIDDFNYERINLDDIFNFNNVYESVITKTTKKLLGDMNNDFSVRSIMEQYYSNTEQMTQALKDVKKLQKLQDKTREIRKEFIQNVMGKTLYKKYDAAGLFAPVPMNALKITFKDFADLATTLEPDPSKTEKLIDYLHEKYYKYKELAYSDEPEALIRTNIVFETIDDIINFFFNVLASYTRVYRTEDINWKPIVKKFRAYLN